MQSVTAESVEKFGGDVGAGHSATVYRLPIEFVQSLATRSDVDCGHCWREIDDVRTPPRSADRVRSNSRFSGEPKNVPRRTVVSLSAPVWRAGLSDIFAPLSVRESRLPRARRSFQSKSHKTSGAGKPSRDRGEKFDARRSTRTRSPDVRRRSRCPSGITEAAEIGYRGSKKRF